MNRWLPLLGSAAACLLLAGCMKWHDVAEESFDASGHGLFIVNEGNFHYGNATLSYYDPASGQVENEVFLRANGFKLGDVAQSMTVRGGKGWIVVNNSHVVFAVDAATFREEGRIEGLTSPRCIHFVSDTKAYVSQLWDNRIFIVDPARYAVTGHITVPGMEPGNGSTEQMVQFGDYVYCNCWSYQDRIIRIDTATDQVDAQLKVGIQPRSIAIDAYGKLWVLTDGGYEGSPYGHEPPGLIRIDAATFKIEKTWLFAPGDTPAVLCLDGSGTVLYWINGDVWRMDVTAADLPAEPFIPSRGTIYYALTVSPFDGDIYIADAIDYQQPGSIARFSPSGELLEEFYVGITPGAFAWK